VSATDRVNATYRCQCGEGWTETDIPIGSAGPVALCTRCKAPMGTFLNPTASVLAKLASIAVHAEEMLSADGHQFDRLALQTLLNDPEVLAFLEAGRHLAMIPEKRS